MTEFTLHKQIEADSILVRNLALSQVRLQNQKAVPWLILVPRRVEATEIHQLSAEDSAILMREIVQASRVMEKLYAPDKINVAALGNVVPQLHIHIIARFTKDAAWPQPVWGKFAPQPYSLPALAELKKKFNEDELWAS